MAKTQTKNPHPIIKILSDLNLLPEKGEDVDAESYKRAVRTAIITIEASSKDKAGDKRSRMLREEVKRIKELEREKIEVTPPKQEVKEKRTTIRGDKLMGRETKKDAPPTADKPKLLPGSSKAKSDDVKPADVDKKQKDSSSLDPDKLNSIAKTVESIALLLRRQFNLEKKQQRDSRKQQSKDDRDAREDKLEAKPDKKTGGLPKAIAKPALGFFERIKKFFLNIVIGSIVLKLFKWIKDPANAEKVTKFKDFLVNNAGWILGGLAAIALLPIAVGLVGVVQGVLAGLSLLGPLLPALPWILGGILLGAVAWWIGKKISKGITGGKVIGGERKENLERLRAAGIMDAKENSLTLIDPEKGEGRLKVNMYGENSITGREWKPGDPGGKTWRPNLDLMIPEHAAYYVRTYGQAALDEKLATHSSFRDTKAALIDTKKDKQKAITEARKKWFLEGQKESKELGFEGDIMTDGALRKMTRNKREKEWKTKKNLEWEKIKADIEKEADEKAIRIGDESEANLKAQIDPNKKLNNIVPGPSNGKSGGVTILDGGGTETGTVGSSGGSGDSNDGDDNFSSEDPNDSSVFSSKSTYNIGG